MPSSTSSSEPAGWRRFIAAAAGTAAIGAFLVYAFVAIVDPFDTLHLSPDFDRPPVTTNARFGFPALARSRDFDSALIGTSTSRLLRPDALDPLLDARFVNLSMNAATAYEQSQLLRLFMRRHAAPKFVMVGIDVEWCATGDELRRFTPRPFPEWMYDNDPWNDYRNIFSLYAVEQAGQLFGILTGFKPERYGRDGYTNFVPDDRLYDADRAATHLGEVGAMVPYGERQGAPGTWRFPALEMLRDDLGRLPDATRKVLFFVPYNRVLIPPADGPVADIWNECKRRVAALASALPGAAAIDFMRPSPITMQDTNYWDPLHYRVGIAERLARDLALAARGEPSSAGDFVVLARSAPKPASIIAGSR